MHHCIIKTNCVSVLQTSLCHFDTGAFWMTLMDNLLQAKGLRPVWILECVLKSSLRKNFLPHSSHSWSLCFSWSRLMWIWRIHKIVKIYKIESDSNGTLNFIPLSRVIKYAILIDRYSWEKCNCCYLTFLYGVRSVFDFSLCSNKNHT